jgi:hypothetical protein
MQINPNENNQVVVINDFKKTSLIHVSKENDITQFQYNNSNAPFEHINTKIISLKESDAIPSD